MTPSFPESAFRRWYWLLIPLLAIAAYATVLRIGFLGDDFVLLAEADSRRVGFDLLMPRPGWFLYRPIGSLLIWDLGVRLWGNNPFPFHLQGLLLHALTSLALGLWLAEATSRRFLGWLAGALFAVFPLHLEAVGWVSAQWDALSALFGIGGLWLFTMWWRRGGSRLPLYLLSLFLYSLALFTKDSLLTFLPLFAFSAWLVTPRPKRKEMLRAFYALVPFCAVLALNLGLRLAVWGNLGGYPGLATDYSNFFWDGLLTQVHVILSPINAKVLGNTLAQVVGALSSAALLLGLVLYGRQWLKLLVVGGAWLLLALAPVLNLPANPDDLQQNRLFYLASAGYCVVVAALLYSVVLSVRRRPLVAMSLTGVLLLLGIAACWAQLRPWHTATVQAEELNQELLRLVPPPASPRPNVMTWYVENSPHDYKGAYLVHLAVGVARYFIGERDVPAVIDVQPVTEAPIIADAYDLFALHFAYYENETRFHADYVEGITSSSPPPSSQEVGSGLILWDFRDCAPDVISGWRVEGAQELCEPGPQGGIILRESGGDTQLLGPPVDIKVMQSGARFVRLRVSVRYPAQVRKADADMEGVKGQWFWHGPGEEWHEAKSCKMRIREAGISHVYWTFILADEAGDTITGLRFDPVDSPVNAAIQWIAVDIVK